MASPALVIRGASRFAARIARLEKRAVRDGQRVETLASEMTAAERRLSSALGAQAATTARAAETVADLRLAHAFASRNQVNAMGRHVETLKELANTQAAEAKHLAKLAETAPTNIPRNAEAIERANRIAAVEQAKKDVKIAAEKVNSADQASKQAQALADSSGNVFERRAAKVMEQRLEATIDEHEKALAILKKAQADANAARAERRIAVQTRAKRSRIHEAGQPPGPATIDDLAEEAAVKAEQLDSATETAILSHSKAQQVALRAEEAALENATEVIARLSPLAEAGDREAQRQIRRMTDMSHRVAYETAKEAKLQGEAIDPTYHEAEKLISEPLPPAGDKTTQAIDDAIEDLLYPGAKDDFAQYRAKVGEETVTHYSKEWAEAEARATQALERATAIEAAAGNLTTETAASRIEREIAVRAMTEKAAFQADSALNNLFYGRYGTLGDGLSETASHAQIVWRIRHQGQQLAQASVEDLNQINNALDQLPSLKIAVQQKQDALAKLTANEINAGAAATPGATESAALETANKEAREALAKYHQHLQETNQLLDRVIQSVTVGGAGVMVVAAATDADAAEQSVKESREFYHYAGNELRQANDAVAAAEAALDNFSGSETERLELEARLASALELAGEAQKLYADAETSYVEARVDKKLSDKEAAAEKAATEAEARGEAYFKSTAEGMAWEGMKWVGKGALTGLHYAEEGVAYAVDGVGYVGQWPVLISSPEDAAAVGHGILAATDAVIEHVVVPVAMATYEGAVAEANPMAPLEEAREREEKAAERFASAAEIRDDDEIDKSLQNKFPNVIIIPDAEPQTPTLVAEAKRKKRSDAAWAKIEEKANQSIERNMSLMGEGTPEEEANMSMDPSLAPPPSTTAPKV